MLLHFYTDSDALGVRWFTRSGWRRTKDDLILEVTLFFLQYLPFKIYLTTSIFITLWRSTFETKNMHWRNVKEVSDILLHLHRTCIFQRVHSAMMEIHAFWNLRKKVVLTVTLIKFLSMFLIYSLKMLMPSLSWGRLDTRKSSFTRRPLNYTSR